MSVVNRLDSRVLPFSRSLSGFSVVLDIPEVGCIRRKFPVCTFGVWEGVREEDRSFVSVVVDRLFVLVSVCSRATNTPTGLGVWLAALRELGNIRLGLGFFGVCP